LNREEKAAVVEELSATLDTAKIAIIADYKGLTVSSLQELRRELKGSNAEIRVTKNTLLRRAISGTPFEAIDEHLQGTTALAVSFDDPVAPAKILSNFAKDHEQLALKGGVLDGKVLSVDDLTALAKLPSREALLGQTLSVMQAVPTGFVRVLSAVPQSLVYTLQAIKDQKEQATN